MEKDIEQGKDFVRPSSLKQAMLCPGSHYMQKGLPETTSEAAEEGTKLHAVLAEGIVKGVLPLEGLTSEQTEAVFACWDVFSEESGRYGEDKTCDAEVHLVLNGGDGEYITEGTADVVIRDKDRVTIVDWKFGREKVAQASENSQVACYAAAAMKTYGVSECRAVIYQPRINSLSFYTFTNADAIARFIGNVNRNATDASLPLSLCPSEEACRYCRAKNSCMAFQRAFNSVTIRPDLSAIDPSRLAHFYEVGQMVKKWIENDLEKAMGAYLDEHGSLEGYEWKEIQGRREVTDIQGLADVVSELCTKGDFIDACSVSLTKLYEKCESTLQSIDKNNGGKGTKKDAKASFEAMTAPFVGRGKPSRRIVRNTKEN